MYYNIKGALIKMPLIESILFEKNKIGQILYCQASLVVRITLALAIKE